MSKLALGITDNNAPDNLEIVHKRMKQYVEWGIANVRIGPYYSTDASDRWELEQVSKEKIRAIVEHGLTIKLIPSTVSRVPAYLARESGVHMVNQYGALSNHNCIGYWYEGAEEYIAKALKAQLLAVQEIGCLDAVVGLVVDAGAAGEGIYPAGWTQEADYNAMWCYDDNAMRDFRVKMEDKYGSVAKANEAWGAKYDSFDEVIIPKPGEARGTLWKDVLTWYLQVKRDFIEREIVIFKKVLEELQCDGIRLILYLPGTWFTDAEWNTCVATGTVTEGIMLGADNPAIVELAAKYDCYLQYTGVETIEGVQFIRQFMQENDYEHIPMIGENAAHEGLLAQIEDIFTIIKDMKLYGVDFTDCSFLFDEDGNVNEAGKRVGKCMKNL